MTTLEPTSSASKITYQVEAMRLLNSNKTIITNYIETAKKLQMFPQELNYLASFYDKKTGSSGTFFENTKENNYILAYTGTNPYTDAQKDIEADIYGIALGQGDHYFPCINFYKKMMTKYGDDIILTGHSLGGNIAQRVALEFNVKHSVVYNSAPLYIENGVDLFMTPDDNNMELYNKRIKKYKKNVNSIKEKIATFTGEVIHFASEDDILNRTMAGLKGEAIYITKNYILKNGGWHPMKLLTDEHRETILSILYNDIYDKEVLTDAFQPLNHDDKIKITNVASNRNLALEYFLSIFDENSKILNYLENKLDDVDINKFFNYLISKIEDE